MNSDVDSSCCRCSHSITSCTLILYYVISCVMSAYIYHIQWWSIWEYYTTTLLSPFDGRFWFTRYIAWQTGIVTLNYFNLFFMNFLSKEDLQCKSKSLNYDRKHNYNNTPKLINTTEGSTENHLSFSSFYVT